MQDIVFRKTSGQASKYLPGIYDHIVWYGKKKDSLKYRTLFGILGEDVSDSSYNCVEGEYFAWRRLKKK